MRNAGDNNGFAAAHVAVEKAVHGVARCQVIEDLGEDAFLGGGEIEGQRFEEFREHRALA